MYNVIDNINLIIDYYLIDIDDCIVIFNCLGKGLLDMLDVVFESLGVGVG